jgi:hypothetical protein
VGRGLCGVQGLSGAALSHFAPGGPVPGHGGWAGLPLPAETADLREGPDPHPALTPLLPLVGIWRGTGHGGYPTIADFAYGQQVRFAHDGRPFLHYESRAWLLGADGTVLRPAAREVGWWRPGAEAGEFEVLLAHPTGVVEIYLGRLRGPDLQGRPASEHGGGAGGGAEPWVQWELSTDVVARAATAKEVTGNRRLYGIVDGALRYAVDMAAVGQQLGPHLAARLERIVG